MARADFEGQAGGSRIDDFDFTVTDAWFGESEALNEASGQNILMLHLVGTTDLEDRPVLEAEGFHPSFKLKEGWEARNGGKSVEYVGTGKSNFGTWYGRFCDAALTLTQSVANTDQDPLNGDNHPTVAATWIGSKWHMNEQSFDFGSLGSHDHLMPSAFLGMVGAASATPVAGVTAANGAGGDLRSQIEALAKASGSYAEFQTQALSTPGVSSDAALLMDIADESKLYARANS